MELVDGRINLDIYSPYESKVISKSLEELVKELVVYIIPLTFHIETLKSLSIIMRTAIVKRLKIFGYSGKPYPHGADLSLEGFGQYIPIESYLKLKNGGGQGQESILERAVIDTEGIIISYKGRPIEPRFHIACGGATENSENVDGNVVQYLRRVLCKYCRDSPHYFAHKDIYIEDLQKSLDSKWELDDYMKTMEIEDLLCDMDRDEADRVIRLKFFGQEYRARDFVDLLKLNSTRFTCLPKKIRFYTIGKGDGLGLCQYGANQMALEGKKAEEILKYYYTGIDLKKIEIKDMKKPLMGKNIMLDPAHGGHDDKGNEGYCGSQEKDINLAICLYLEEELQKLGASVYMTRKEDEQIPIMQRAAMANAIKDLDFFISIHQNHFKYPCISGSEIYYYRGDKEARDLGKVIMDEIFTDLGLINRGVKRAEFFLLRDVNVSSLHIEVAYISNPRDESLLVEKKHQKSIALAIAKGLVKYYGYLI